MSDAENAKDVRAIEEIIDRQFRSLEWSPGQEADWPSFTSDFHEEATLYPSARPVRSRSVEEFVERMQGLTETSLRSFKERMLGAHVRVFGNVAIAMAACHTTENETSESRGVEAMLLVKDEEVWKIVGQGWDTETDQLPIPDDLLSNTQ